MKTLYCDCFSGISGDMFLGAMLDAGFPLEKLNETFQQLHMPEYQDAFLQDVMKGAIRAAQVSFAFTESCDHRHYSEIQEMLEQSALSASIKEKSLLIFSKLAEAESQVHGTPVEDVHFHEVGAVDSILDIVGAAAALDYFGIERVCSSALPQGKGTVETQHGMLPIPAPATLVLLTNMQAKMEKRDIEAELVTPTGAAILAAFARFEQPSMRLQSSGIGAGRRELPWPNVLRVMIGESEGNSDGCVKLETNIDDMTAELLAAVMERLFQAGALDVYFSSIQMKKNRPGCMLSVIARASDAEKLGALILEHTTTLGVRVSEFQRITAEREEVQIESSFGSAVVKVKKLNGKITSIHPAFEACERLAREYDMPVSEVSRIIQREAEKKLFF